MERRRRILRFGPAVSWLPVLGLCIAASCSDTRVVAVEIAVIELVPDNASILVGEWVQFEARLLDGSGNVLSGRDVEWSSSHPSAVPVDAAGLVRGDAAALATITAASANWQAIAEVAVNRPAPAVTAIQPSSAQRLRTLDLVLTGSHFEDGVTAVDMGDGITIDAIEVTAPKSITVRATILAGAQLGARDIAVTIPGPGGGTATLPGGFTVLAEHPSPTVTGVSPAEGQRQTTVAVTVAGSGFLDGATTVSFGPGISVTGVSVQRATSLTATIAIAADAALGARDVSVTNPAPGGGTATLGGGFTVRPVNPTPALEGASPSEVQRRDARDVTLAGSGFILGVTTVSFGPDITVEDVRVDGPTSLTASIRIGAGASLGTRQVSATNPAPGGGTGTLTDGFTILEENPAPTATMALPEVGVRGVTMNVTVIGSGFVQGLTSVGFGPRITVNAVTIHFWTSLTANITIDADADPGPRDIAVTNAGPGGGTFIMHNGFTVAAAGGN